MPFRGHTYMMSLRWREGGWPKCNDSTDWLREWDSNKDGGAMNPNILRSSKRGHEIRTQVEGVSENVEADKLRNQ